MQASFWSGCWWLLSGISKPSFKSTHYTVFLLPNLLSEAGHGCILTSLYGNMPNSFIALLALGYDYTELELALHWMKHLQVKTNAQVYAFNSIFFLHLNLAFSFYFFIGIHETTEATSDHCLVSHQKNKDLDITYSTTTWSLLADLFTLSQADKKKLVTDTLIQLATLRFPLTGSLADLVKMYVSMLCIYLILIRNYVEKYLKQKYILLPLIWESCPCPLELSLWVLQGFLV